MFDFIMFLVLSACNTTLAIKTGLHWSLGLLYAFFVFIGYFLVSVGWIARVYYIVPKDALSEEEYRKLMKKDGEK